MGFSGSTQFQRKREHLGALAVKHTYDSVLPAGAAKTVQNALYAENPCVSLIAVSSFKNVLTC